MSAVRSPTQRQGDAAEEVALEFLREQGLELLARNVASRVGEIDLLMRDGSEWVFVEVRSRARPGYGGAAASVTPAKQRRIRLQAQLMLQRQFGGGSWPACRFDVCALDGASPQTRQVTWIRGAF